LRETWIVKHIPYTAYVIGNRKVKVMKKGEGKILSEEPVYVNPEQWTLKTHPELLHEDVAKKDMVQAHKHHEKELAEMNKKQKDIKTSYTLTPSQNQDVEESLKGFGASGKDTKMLLKKANSTTFGVQGRIQCRQADQPTTQTAGGDDKTVLD